MRFFSCYVLLIFIIINFCAKLLDIYDLYKSIMVHKQKKLIHTSGDYALLP